MYLVFTKVHQRLLKKVSCEKLPLSSESWLNNRRDKVGWHSKTRDSIGLDLTVAFHYGEEYTIWSHRVGDQLFS